VTFDPLQPYLNPGGHRMKSQETDTRDHDTAADAFDAEVKRSRAANADKQADEMARILGPNRTDPDKPQAASNGWSIQDVLDDQADQR
jgi:hypothetical protein